MPRGLRSTMFACARKGMTNDQDKASMSSPAMQDREPIEEQRNLRRRLCLVGSRMCSMMLVFISQPHSVHKYVCIAFDPTFGSQRVKHNGCLPNVYSEGEAANVSEPETQLASRL